MQIENEICHMLSYAISTQKRVLIFEKAVLPSLIDEGGGGISPTRPTVAVLTFGEKVSGCDWLDCPLGRGGATEANLFGWL